jgi:pyruvate dehydrogenase E1 component alpha subunit
MPSAQVDGMDLVAVHNKTKEMLEAIRGGAGPMFLEVMTYRFRGHSMGDPERYRKSDEVHKWQENDPIGIYRRYLLEHQLASEEELNEVDNKGVQIVEEAVQFAESSPEPAPEALYENIYVSEQC